MFKIQILRKFSTKVLQDINQLLPQLALSSVPPKLLTPARLKRLLKQNNVYLVTVVDSSQKLSRIIAMATVYLVYIPTGAISVIEDVVVDMAYRGKGLGRKLTEKLIEIAMAKKAKHISVRTNPVRIESNAMYISMGFIKKETNFYRINLPWK
ncbi:MAG: GNAT family N-acetyltransferase [bacterium]|nr:GNAT family N-acetyltransferase [bacterium]